jgi:anion-transporting  ArsA/GET3 family ATPase
VCLRKATCAHAQGLNLGQLLDTPPPGIDEAVAISRVVRFLRSADYGQFRAVVFDTAPTGHTLRLLTLPDFFNTGIGKLVRLRFTIANAVSRVTDFFSRKKGSGRAVDKAMAKLEELQARAPILQYLFGHVRRLPQCLQARSRLTHAKWLSCMRRCVQALCSKPTEP